MTAASSAHLTIRWLPKPGPLEAHPCGQHPCVSVTDHVVHGAADPSGATTLCRRPTTIKQPGMSEHPTGAAICGVCRTAATKTSHGGGPGPY